MNEEKLSYLKNFTLLLVDDDGELLNKLHIILSIFFKNVIMAQDGKEALDIYRAEKINMIITDYTMPIMSGFELCKEIRKINRQIPMVIMSNYSDKEKLLNSIPLSLAQYLIKPISYTTLTSTLLNMLDSIEIEKVKIVTISDLLSYDMLKKELISDIEKVSLSKNEVALMELFLKNKNKLLSTIEIDLCLDPVEQKSTHALKSLIYRLRKKVGKDIILNMPGYGYMFKSQ